MKNLNQRPSPKIPQYSPILLASCPLILLLLHPSWSCPSSFLLIFLLPCWIVLVGLSPVRPQDLIQIHENPIVICFFPILAFSFFFQFYFFCLCFFFLFDCIFISAILLRYFIICLIYSILLPPIDVYKKLFLKVSYRTSVFFFLFKFEVPFSLKRNMAM